MMKYFPLRITAFTLMSLFFYSCVEEESDLENSTAISSVSDASNQFKEPPEIIILKDTKCESFDEQIVPISQEELDRQLAKDKKNVSDKILIEINKDRKSQGLLELSDATTTAKFLALQHNDYQISENTISHDDSQLRSCTIFKLEQARSTGENVASGYETAEAVVNAWLGSPSHRENIRGDFSKIGIGSTLSGEGELFFT